MRIAATLMGGLMLTAAMPAIAQETAAAPIPLRPGTAAQEQLTNTGPRLVEFDMYYDLYSFRADAGERVQIDMRSDAFDPYLELGRVGADGKFTAVAENDDADGLNARIVQTIGEGGDYLVRARTVSPGSTGAYTIELKRLGEAAPPAPPVALRAGQATSASFTEDGAMMTDEQGATTSRPFRLYSFDARAGQTYTVSMKSAAFDTFVELGALTPIGFASARSNDDGEGDAGGDNGTDSQLVFRAERAGPVVIRASALTDGSAGDYTIEVR